MVISTNRGQASSTFSLRHATHAVILREMSGSFRSPNASRRAMADDEAGPSEALIVLDHGVESVICSHCAGDGSEGMSRKLCADEARGCLLPCDWLATHLILPVDPHLTLLQYVYIASSPMASSKRASSAVFVPHA